MHRAKVFFFVSAGLLCLALAYHLGAQSAVAQSGVASVGEINWNSGAMFSAVQGRTIYAVGVPNPPDNGFPVQVFPPVPGTSPIIAVDAFSNGALLENGDVYIKGSGGWTLKGNLFGAPTPALQQTWGATKARYRAPAAGAQTTR